MKITNLIIQQKYLSLLNRIEWKIFSKQILKRDNYICQNCYTNEKILHVHHLIYLKNRKPWDYPENYMMTLCEDCHISEHMALDLIEYDIKEMLLSGMLAIDIYKKLKNNEIIKLI